MFSGSDTGRYQDGATSFLILLSTASSIFSLSYIHLLLGFSAYQAIKKVNHPNIDWIVNSLNKERNEFIIKIDSYLIIKIISIQSQAMKDVQKKGRLYLRKIWVCVYVALKSHKLCQTNILIMTTIQLMDVLGFYSGLFRLKKILSRVRIILTSSFHWFNQLVNRPDLYFTWDCWNINLNPPKACLPVSILVGWRLFSDAARLGGIRRRYFYVLLTVATAAWNSKEQAKAHNSDFSNTLLLRSANQHTLIQLDSLSI